MASFRKKSHTFHTFHDRFTNINDVVKAMKDAGLEKCGLVFGIDYTMSNKVQGEKTFEGRSLHEISDERENPYQQVIEIIGATLEEFDDDRIIPAYGFGDFEHKTEGLFKMKRRGECVGFNQVLATYTDITPGVRLHRPTNFAPLIYQAIEIVRHTGKYHILVIVADGQVTAEQETQDAIVAATSYALSIIVIGVGDGPWGMMEEFDDKLPSRTFDNFQFVNFHDVMSHASHPEAEFAMHCLMEIPDQYKTIRRLGYLRD